MIKDVALAREISDMMIAIVLVWPPAVINQSHRYLMPPMIGDHWSTSGHAIGLDASISDVRVAILLLAVATFIAAVVSGVVSAVRHRASSP